MIKHCLVALIWCLPVAGWSASISVGGTQLTIPNPPGFVVLTPQMNSVYELQQRFIAPTNQQFIAFIAESEVPKALNDEIPELDRTFSVKTTRESIDHSFSTADFSQLKQISKTQNEELLKKAENEIPGLLDKVNRGIKEQFDADIVLSMSQMIPLPPHEETDRTLAYSAFVKFGARDEHDPATSYVGVVTATIVHIRSKRGRNPFLIGMPSPGVGRPLMRQELAF